MEKPTIVFMGTPEFAVPALERINSEYGVKAVVTVPDKPKGRGLKLLPSAIKVKALELGIPILQPEKLNDPGFTYSLEALEPDIIVVIAFRILPEVVYTSAKMGTFNIHGSLLPKYRGAAPINWAIINGEKYSGLTSFLLKKVVDTGDILLQKPVEIPENFTAGDLHDLLMPEASQLSVDTIKILTKGNYKAFSQDNNMASLAPKIYPEQCRIDWSMDASKQRNFIHGMSPVPGAWTLWNGKRLKIYRVELLPGYGNNPGNYQIDNSRFIINCLNGMLGILELQPEGRKQMKTEEFLGGYRGGMKGSFE